MDGISRLVAATDTNGQYSDPATARVIYLLSGGLVLMAVALAAGTVWWWRSSKTEHPALGPLEEMGTRRFWKSDYSDRRRRLTDARPAGAAAAEATEDADPVDRGAFAVGDPSDYEDLLDEEVAAERAAAREAAAVAVAEDAVVVAAVHDADDTEMDGDGDTDDTETDDDTDAHEMDDLELDGLDGIGSPIDPLLRARAAE